MRAASGATLCALVLTSVAACSHAAGNGSAPGSRGVSSSSGVLPPSGSAAAASGTATSAGATGPAAPLTTVAPVPQTTLPAVALTSPVTVNGTVRVQLSQVRRSKVTGRGPGVIVGQQAVQFDVTITNTSRAAVSLDAVDVTAAYGQPPLPAGSAPVTGSRPLRGVLQPGASASGTYGFALPTGPSGPLVVTLTYSVGAPTVLFQGSL